MKSESAPLALVPQQEGGEHHDARSAEYYRVELNVRSWPNAGLQATLTELLRQQTTPMRGVYIG